ncbi:uncharacterized protein LOC127641001 [Xyrauchen texanus]|uniref:uncharacterized protein LOC127641001 n=1 Tax=Xyrauchen texanus TaxID=154827 RepID=UPI0022427778|nr:uncharacterized protein LOC127641001 [Xyrauchen texanus]
MNQQTTEVNIPLGFKTILEWFSRAVILIQPNDIQQFAAFYFKELLRLREEKPNLDIYGLLKEFQDDRVALLTSLCTENDDAPLTQTAADYNEYLNEDGIRSILVGADQTDTVVVFRKTAKNKSSPPTDVPDSTSHRDSALFERVPLSQIDFTPNTVLIKTQSIPCKYMILVQSEKVPECIVFQRDYPESPPQAEETVGKDESHDEKMESALAISLIAEISESSEESVEVKSELAELIEKFKGFMNRLVSPQQKSKDSLETYLSTSKPIETTTSSLVPPQISSLEESSEQATTKSGPTSEPVEVATDHTCRPVSRSHGSVSPVAATKINPIQAKLPSMSTHANEKPTMTYSTYMSPETMPTANVLPNETRVSMDPTLRRTL